MSSILEMVYPGGRVLAPVEVGEEEVGLRSDGQLYR
jgi:hypothetical protein